MTDLIIKLRINILGTTLHTLINTAESRLLVASRILDFTLNYQ